MFTLNCHGKRYEFPHPVVMGIINVTPDSFYGESRHQGRDAVLKEAEKMIREGAAILDIGGQSTRPGSERVSADEEMARVLGPVEALRRAFPDMLISIDTFYGDVAEACLQAGASLVNDISAGSMDERLWPVVARWQVPYVLMHMKGTPATMQKEPAYADIGKEIKDFFREKMTALETAGIRELILDPGFGFGKTVAHNLALIRQLPAFAELGFPLLLGVSRKSTIARILDITADESLNGTTVLHTIGLLNGASILRAHDVKEAQQAIRLVQYYRDTAT